MPLDLLLSGKFPAYDENNRIVGGTVVTPNSLPFQIALLRSGSLSCGGSIVSNTKILCAAHCTVNIVISNYQVVAGEHDLKTTSGLEQRRSISRVVNHPSYNANTQANDVSTIHLSSALTLNAQVATIALASTTLSAGTAVTVSGWGTTSSGGSISNTLRSVVVNVVSDANCNTAYGAGSILSSMLCAAATGKDSCQGDSGGPLFTGTGASATQHGVVSWGYGCADSRYPGVYTEVQAFRTWILNN
jgi:trypsin